MVSYEPKKNGPRPYNGTPTQSYHIDSYYRTPVGKPKGPRSSNDVNSRLWDDGQYSNVRNSNITNLINSHQRMGSFGSTSTGGESFDADSLIDSYSYQNERQEVQRKSFYNNIDSTYPSNYSQDTPQYQPMQPNTTSFYHSPSTIIPQNEVRIQPLAARPSTKSTTNKSGRRSPQLLNQYGTNFSPFSLRVSPITPGTVSNLIIPEDMPTRRSTESTRERPKPPIHTQRTERIRSFSLSETSSMLNSDGLNSPSSPSSTMGKQPIPIVYPALLSRVAEAFHVRVALSTRIKDNVEYKDCFDGREAVDKIAFIIKTTDRNLALLLGRALDAQKFFHDVTYDHRLRDSPNELYQFRKMRSILSHSDSYDTDEEEEIDEIEESDLPNGVFTLLTDCYSPTCTRDNLCYSIACPRRLEQTARKSMKPKRTNSQISNSVSETEKKRQEAINEVIYTEKDFVRDLEYLRDCWMTQILSQNFIPEFRRESFVKDVFSNIMEIYLVNSKLSDALIKRQNSYAIVNEIGDIFLEHVPSFKPFISYGARQLWGKYEFEKEKSTNPLFAKFVEDTERRPESRKLELNGYLTKPTTRLGRYPLLLEVVLKNTPQDHPDRENIPKVIKIIKEILTNVNIESGKSENRFNLQHLHDQLINDTADLKLTEEGRQIIFKGSLKKSTGAGESSDLHVFLLDHALLMVKTKIIKLLRVSTSEALTEGKNVNARRPPSILPTRAAPVVVREKQFALTFSCLGKKGFSVTLYAATFISRKKWIEIVEKQREILNEKGKVFENSILLERKIFTGANKVVCAAFFDNHQKLAFGTDTGVYVLEIGQINKQAVRVLQIERVTQMEILEEFRLLLLLADKTLYTYTLDALDPNPDENNVIKKSSRKIMAHVSFFKTGTCLGKSLVTVVKNSALASIIKTLEPLEQNTKSKSKGPLKNFLRSSNDSLKTYREFYIPTELVSVHFLKKKLCVGCCAKGFEVVDLENLKTQGLLDPEDTSHEFVFKNNHVKPIALHRVGGDFLLCYDGGWRSRPDWIIYWEGNPNSFALVHPYILAFEPSFIEVRNVETGLLEQIIEGHNMRCLYSDSHGNIVVATNDPVTDSSEVFTLKLVNGRRGSLQSEATN
ncbi:6938_t:CDS:10 [Diversispora eburnea]|uniref:6938_t:CDS:1 n=1 Tax=Diversispora eburnea TaxID=1213867 RepID=A0A9N9A114_9GLOM|nr:6938_t:CDS:10 [Diversispora eburnea]